MDELPIETDGLQLHTGEVLVGPSTTEIFRVANDVVLTFLDEQINENDRLPSIWSDILANALSEINSNLPTDQNESFNLERWSGEVGQSISDRMLAVNTYNLRQVESTTALESSDSESVDQLHGISTDVEETYIDQTTQMIEELNNIWEQLSHTGYANQYSEGTVDRARLIALTKAIEQFKMSQLYRDNMEGWAGKLFGKISQMMESTERAIRDKNDLLSDHN